ncbi:MAG: hypothetical protein HY701_00445, partial [Gemmatimonadetes bacterium]|nr:hypothetical protein [Gemmatimonadota bacterium]
DQLSLAIGKNGQNVRLASQLVGWQIDLYGSREWLERGAEAALFGGATESTYDVADFSLRELELPPATLAALEAAGYTMFFDIIDIEREDLLRIQGMSPEEADRVLRVIDELTVEEAESSAESETGPDSATSRVLRLPVESPLAAAAAEPEATAATDAAGPEEVQPGSEA